MRLLYALGFDNTKDEYFTLKLLYKDHYPELITIALKYMKGDPNYDG